MDADRLPAGLMALLGVLAVAATAASVDGTQQSSSSGRGGDAQVGQGQGGSGALGSGSGGEFSPLEDVISPDVSFPIADVFGVLVAIGAVFFVVYVGYRYWNDGLEGLLEVAAVARDVIIGVGFVGLAAAFFLQLFFRQFTPPGRSPRRPAEPGSAGQSAVETAPTGGIDPLVIGFLIGAVVLGVALVLVATNRFSLGGDETGGTSVADEDESDEEGAGPSAPSPDVALARGSYDDVEASNEVYHAWRTLASSVDGRRGADRTPAELARDAVDAGLDRQAVHTLRETFEEVRYGHRPADADRESRARSAVERLDPDRGDRA